MYNILKHFYLYYNGTPWSSQFYVRYIWCSGSIADCIWVVYVGSSPGGLVLKHSSSVKEVQHLSKSVKKVQYL
jgi:hypothetical protein